VLKDIQAYDTYMNAPLHLQIDRAGLPLVKNMISQDLTDDPDPLRRQDRRDPPEAVRDAC
jgi:hypothetical protein